jgi:hypothetical protein
MAHYRIYIDGTVDLLAESNETRLKAELRFACASRAYKLDDPAMRKTSMKKLIKLDQSRLQEPSTLLPFVTQNRHCLHFRAYLQERRRPRSSIIATTFVFFEETNENVLISDDLTKATLNITILLRCT